MRVSLLQTLEHVSLERTMAKKKISKVIKMVAAFNLCLLNTQFYTANQRSGSALLDIVPGRSLSSPIRLI